MVEKLLVPGALYRKMKKVLFAHDFVQPSFILILLFMPGPCRVKEVRGEERTIKSLPIKMFLRRIGMLNRHLFQVQYEVNSTIHFMAQSLIDLFPAFLVVSLAFCLLDLSFPD
jgi:hypothetical protein|uniref:Uncharacterized protein n=1 Tax=Fagus sylvatica TaxID=28930 RepID=A0A7L7T950_FAGSY|nr:hypothetical protein [Fagus sylvatica]QOC70544.1 hypothetical protein [Fagus sylvatica]QVG61347.1 hypothetical protein [Fagus sylvatica]QVG61403.1 hypothetical protein [Fagus sylvatica]